MSQGSTTRKLSQETAKDYMAFLARHAPVIVLLTEPAAGSEFPLQSVRIVLGRGPGADLVFDDDHLSRQHVAFELTGHGYQLSDLGSTNGVRVNDQNTTVKLLEHGDRITIGRLTFQYVVQERTERSEFEIDAS